MRPKVASQFWWNFPGKNFLNFKIIGLFIFLLAEHHSHALQYKNVNLQEHTLKKIWRRNFKHNNTNISTWNTF